MWRLGNRHNRKKIGRCENQERSEYKRGIQVPAGWTNKTVVGGGQVQHHTAHGPPSELLSPPSDKYHITLRSGAKQSSNMLSQHDADKRGIEQSHLLLVVRRSICWRWWGLLRSVTVSTVGGYTPSPLSFGCIRMLDDAKFAEGKWFCLNSRNPLHRLSSFSSRVETRRCDQKHTRTKGMYGCCPNMQESLIPICW